MSVSETWNNLCSPAQLYFIMTALGFLFTAWGFPKSLSTSTVVYQGLIALIWTYLLGWICTKGWSGVSWFLVIAPVVVSILVMFTLKKEMSAAPSRPATPARAYSPSSASSSAPSSPAPKKVTLKKLAPKKLAPNKKDAIDIEIDNL
jgi:hypothetical protein